MGELTRCGLFRLKKDRVFWACFGVMLCAAVAQLSIAARQCRMMAAEGYIVNLESSSCFRQSGCLSGYSPDSTWVPTTVRGRFGTD